MARDIAREDDEIDESDIDDFETAELIPRLALGVDKGVQKNMCFYGKNRVVYPVGKYIAFSTVSTRDMSFLTTPMDVIGIHCLTVCPNRRYLAVAEQISRSRCPQIAIISLNTRKRIRVISFEADQVFSDVIEIRDMDFSQDSKILNILSGNPSVTVLHCDWYQKKFTSSLRANSLLSEGVAEYVYKIRSHPKKQNVVFAALKPGAVWMLTHIQEKDETKKVQAFKKDDFIHGEKNLADMCFLPNGRLVLLWTDAAVSVFARAKNETNEVWHALSHIPSVQLTNFQSGVNEMIDEGAPSIGEGSSIFDVEGEAVCPTNRGFYVAVSRNNTLEEVISYEEPTEETNQGSAAELSKLLRRSLQGDDDVTKEIYNVAKRIHSPSQCKIQCMAASTDGGSLAITTTEGDIVYNDPSGLSGKEQLSKMAGGFCKGSILAMDICEVKLLLAACDDQGDVRVWNWNEASLWAEAKLTRPATALALHPAGWYILLGEDKLRLRVVSAEELTIVDAFSIPFCEAVKFSHGGHLFAASSRTGVLIYDTCTRSLMASLRGHSGVVKALCWGYRDMTLASGCNSGTFYVWTAPEFTRERKRDCISKNAGYTSVASADKTGAFFVTSSDNTLRRVGIEGVDMQLRLPCDIESLVATSNSRFLVASHSSGSISVYTIPSKEITGTLGENSKALHYSPHITGHRSNVIIQSRDNSKVFSAGSDGTAFMFTLSQNLRAASQIPQEQDFSEPIGFATVKQSTLKELREKNSQLEKVIQDQRSEAEYKLSMRDQRWSTEKAEYEKKLQQRHEDLCAQEKKLKDEKAKLQEEYEEQLQQMKTKYESELEETKGTMNVKLEESAREYHELKAEKEDLQQKYEEYISSIRQEHQEALENIRAQYEDYADNQIQNIERKMTEKDDEIRRNQEMLRQVQEDYEQEMQVVEDKAHNAYMAQKQTSQQLQADNTLIKGKMDRTQEQHDEDQRKIEQKEEEKSKLKLQLQRLQNDLSKLKEELRARDVSLDERDAQITRLNKKVTELEKFRFVLQRRKDELAKEVEPQKDEIESVKKELTQRDGAISDHMQSIEKLREQFDGLQRKYHALQKEQRQTRMELQDRKNNLNNLLSEMQKIFNISAGQSDSHLTKEKALNNLLLKYSAMADTDEHAGLSGGRSDKEPELQRVRLEGEVSAMAQKVNYAESMQREEEQNRKQQVSELLKQNAELKRENKRLKDEQRKSSRDSSGQEQAAHSAPRQSQPGPSRADTPPSRQGKQRPATAGPDERASSSKRTKGTSSQHSGWLYTSSSSRAITEMINTERRKQTELTNEIQSRDRTIDQLNHELESLRSAVSERDSRINELKHLYNRAVATRTASRGPSSTHEHVDEVPRSTVSSTASGEVVQGTQIRPSTAPFRQDRSAAGRPTSASTTGLRQSGSGLSRPQTAKRPNSGR